jgi:hypothetical protein
MDNDSSIHKGVYLSIIKFCKEQITEESEIHWKTTLITSKPMEMTNNKQQTAAKWLYLELAKSLKGESQYQDSREILTIALEMEKKQMIRPTLLQTVKALLYNVYLKIKGGEQ